MKREIKFRAWDKFKKEMNYKVLVGNTDINDQNYTCNAILNKESGEWVNADDIGIDLMQFTGLIDKNGKEIYEGDILSSEYIRSYFGVEWNNEVSCYDWYVMTKTKKIGASLAKSIEDAPKKTDKPFSQIIEVIGNIYENPDLLL
jgi:uncharacterized phage protein (TIGR01671 family)